MKKILLAIICFAFVFSGIGQNRALDKAQAFSLAESNLKSIGISQNDLSDMAVAQSYENTEFGVSYVYLQQTYKGLPVQNKILVLAFKNGALVSKAGDIFQNALQYANSADPAVPAQAAVVTAAGEAKAKTPVFVSSPVSGEGKMNFGTLGIAYENITAQLYWLPVEKKNEKAQLRLVWQVLMSPNGSDDMWQIRVDAATNNVLGKNNLTVYESFGDHQSESKQHITQTFAASANGAQPANPSLVNTANYLVIAYPRESPLYGPETLVTNPWTLAGASNPNATSLRWHNDGVNDYTITRGNNAWATEDRNNSNQNTGLPATSSTSPDPLNFNFPPNYTVEPTTAAFQQFAITNLFYWNNIMHDVSYNYGFDEVAGNFQASNQGRGGAGNDHVIALAQSGAGTNNANFSTPADGGRPRMRMYLFTTPTPDRDGDIDNGIIAHEYTHGISNRLTGGIAGAGGCLSNAEEGGEGWSDYFGLMVTTNWATATVNDGPNRRPIGNYVLNQATTGNGIRTRPYSTNFAVNNLTYAFVASSGGEVHDIGEVWCATLWDMTWNIILQDNQINPNLFNAAGAGGNARAMRLVMEGMKLQPCSPGFIDGRDAILRADQMLYNGLYHCAILSAFARRGMGTDASQGSSSLTNDQVVGFSTVETSLTLTQSVTQQEEGLQVTYNNRVTAGACSAITNYLVTDTLPTNVTYVSGGTYNSANRVVSFPVNIAAGASQTYSFTVQINAGSYFPPVNLFEDNVTGTTIPAAIWTATSSTSTNWVVSTARSHSAPSSYYSLNTTAISNQLLTSTNAVAIPATPPNLTFWHWYSTEATFDGGVIEISTDNGTTFNDVATANFLTGGYTTTMAAGTPLAGRRAWSGASNGFIKTVINLTPYAGQNIKLRFRSTTDNGTAGEGWYVDDISVKRVATVDIRSSLFTNNGIRLQTADTFTLIVQPTSCTPVAITGQPQPVTTCSGSTATFTVTATGSGLSYQWQVSTNGGGTYTPINGATSSSLVLTGVTTAMSGNLYRVIVSNNCPSSVTSTGALLTVNPGVAITAQPVSQTVCAGANVTFSVTAAGGTISYQWQVSTNGGGTFTDIAGATSSTLTLNAVTAAMNGNQYHVVVTNTCPSSATSSNVTLTVQTAPAITTQPAANVSACAGSAATFSVTATGSTLTYQWQVSTTGCAGTFVNIAGANAATFSVNPVTAAMSGNAYRVIVSGACPSPVTSGCSLLTVNQPIAITTQPASQTVCAGANVTFTAAASGTNPAYQWQVSTNGGGTFTDIAGAVSATYTITGVTAAMNGNQYHVVVTNGCPSSATSSNATLTVQTAPSISAQPQAVTTCSGSSVTFSVTAAGTGITYQWQSSSTGCGGTFTNIAGAIGSSYTITNVAAAQNGTGYRVIVSGVCTPASVTSNCVLLNVNTSTIVNSQPASVSVCAGSNATFTTSATGTGISYQWQVSTNGGASFTDIAGATSASYTVTAATAAMNGYQYRAVISSTCAAPITTNAATLTVASPAVITAQPSNVVTCATTASFTVAATGTSLSYQWQVSTDGVTYTNIPGATNSTYVLNNLTPAQSGNRYRVIITSALCGSVTSNVVTVQVGATPVVVLTAASGTSSPTATNPGNVTALYTTVSPVGNYVYQWKRNNVILPVLTSSITAANGLLLEFGTYQVTVFDVATGCSGTSNTITISDVASERNRLFIWPNPTRGQIHLSFYNGTAAPLARSVYVYDSKGARVMAKEFTTSGAYAEMMLDLSGMNQGLYMIELRDAQGKKIASDKVIKF